MRILLLIALSFSAFAKTKLDVSLQNAPQFRSKAELLKPLNDDIALGSKKSKVQVTIFDSYSCVHCARFYEEIFPVLEKDYIKTNKILFVHKSFPLDKRALFATKVVNCSSNKLAQAQEVYAHQGTLLESKDYKTALLSLIGVDKSCVSKYNEDGLVKQTFEYSKVLEIRGTPTVLVNGREIERFSKKSLISAIEVELRK